MADNSKQFTIDHLLGNTRNQQPRSVLSSTSHHTLPNNWPNLWQDGLNQPTATLAPPFNFYNLRPLVPLWSSNLWYRYPRINEPALHAAAAGALWRPPVYWNANSLSFMRLTKRYPRKGGQIRFTHEQSNELESVFSKQRYLTPGQRKNLAVKLELSERQVKTWFQNRRAKWRRVRQESTKDGESKSTAEEDGELHSDDEMIKDDDDDGADDETLEILSESEQFAPE